MAEIFLVRDLESQQTTELCNDSPVFKVTISGYGSYIRISGMNVDASNCDDGAWSLLN